MFVDNEGTLFMMRLLLIGLSMSLMLLLLLWLKLSEVGCGNIYFCKLSSLNGNIHYIYMCKVYNITYSVI